MAKYYRVRTQEQWEWLMHWFEEQNENILWTGDILPTKVANPYNDDKCVVSLENNKLMHGDVRYFKRSENITDFIEVSQMMEESKMEDYVTIKGEDSLKIKNEDNRQSFYAYIDDLFIPANYFKELHIPKSLLYPKVKFTEEEKREFDDIKKHVTALYNAMVLIFEHRDECINLNNKLFYSAPPKYLNDVQRDFARAWSDESLIEVIPDKKWNVKIFNSDDAIYWKKQDGSLTVATIDLTDSDRTQFTAEELKHYGLDKDVFEKVEVQND